MIGEVESVKLAIGESSVPSLLDDSKRGPSQAMLPSHYYRSSSSSSSSSRGGAKLLANPSTVYTYRLTLLSSCIPSSASSPLRRN